MVDPLEAVADAIMHVEGWYAGSRSYRNRNPGNLRASHHAIGKDKGGFAIFPSFAMGYAALVTDLRNKFTGNTITRLGPQSTLLQLFEVYAPRADSNTPRQYAHTVAAWLSQALRRSVAITDTLESIYAEPHGPDPGSPSAA